MKFQKAKYFLQKYGETFLLRESKKLTKKLKKFFQFKINGD